MNLYNEIEKSFPVIEKLFNADDLNIFRQMPSSDLFLYHFGVGMWIRNNLLNEKGNLFKSFVEKGMRNKDDMSAFIIASFHKYISSK